MGAVTVLLSCRDVGGGFLWVKKLMRTVEMEEVGGTVQVKLSLIQAPLN